MIKPLSFSRGLLVFLFGFGVRFIRQVCHRVFKVVIAGSKNFLGDHFLG